jgi:hypothetical protein
MRARLADGLTRQSSGGMPDTRPVNRAAGARIPSAVDSHAHTQNFSHWNFPFEFGLNYQSSRARSARISSFLSAHASRAHSTLQ